jgi:ATP-dependent Clp protease, protease subunit
VTAAASQPWFSVRAASSDQPAELLIYDAIGSGSLTAGTLVQQLQAMPKAPLNVRINSPGGNVFDGIAIYNALKSRAAPVTVTVDGIALSIASVVAMAGKPIRMHKSAYMMLHDPSGMVVGGASEMRDMADTLDRLRRTLAGIYAARTGKGADEMLRVMRDETWLTADEAKALRFADEVIPDAGAPQARGAFDLSAFARVPTQVWNCYGNGSGARAIDARIVELEAMLDAGRFSADKWRELQGLIAARRLPSATDKGQ